MDSTRSSISRRHLLVGAVAASAAVALPKIAKASAKKPPNGGSVATRGIETGFSPRTQHVVTEIGQGWALLTGGLMGGRATSSVLLLNMETGETSATTPMNVARSRHAAVLMPDGRVLVMGGFNGRLLNSVEAFDPMTNTWSVMGNLPCARADFGATPTRSGVLLLGGTGEQGPLGKSKYSL